MGSPRKKAAVVPVRFNSRISYEEETPGGSTEAIEAEPESMDADEYTDCNSNRVYHSQEAYDQHCVCGGKHDTNRQQ